MKGRHAKLIFITRDVFPLTKEASADEQVPFVSGVVERTTLVHSPDCAEGWHAQCVGYDGQPGRA